MQDFKSMFAELFELEDAMDKYEWIMEYGDNSTGLDDLDKVPKNKVHGCTSSLWVIKTDNNIMCDADSSIVNGIAHMICDWWNQATATERELFSLNTLMTSGLAPLVSMGRQNGISNLLSKLRQL